MTKCCKELEDKAKIKDLKALSLFDAMVLAAARRLNAKALTADEHFKNTPKTL